MVLSRPVRKQAFTLLEILLVVGILAIVSGLAMPIFYGELVRSRLPESAREFRGLLKLARANAMLDGRRYRIRFPREDEIDGEGGNYQPIVEVEDDPLRRPEQFRPVRASWAEGMTFREGVRCAQVRLGKPNIRELLGELEEDDEWMEELEEVADETFEEDFPPVVFEPDGTSEWATFVLTNAPADVLAKELDVVDVDYEQVEVILDGLIGLCWLQRVFHEEELEMMRDNGWPPVLRKDFLDPDLLTEDDVLEIQDQWGRSR